MRLYKIKILYNRREINMVIMPITFGIAICYNATDYNYES